MPSTRYWCLKPAEYLRRRADFETFGLRTVGLDGRHGELEDLTRRSERQKRGDQHDHYCLWVRSCGYLFLSSLHTTGVKPSTRKCEKHSASNDAHNSSIPSSGLLHSTEAASSNVEMPHTQICANAACASFSRWCLRTGTCCRLPAVLDGAQPHTSAHLAYAQAELVRPWPVGTLPWLPGNPPHSSDVCEATFFSAARLKAKTLEAARGDVPAHSAATLPLSFWDRLRLALSDVNASSKTYSAQLEDLVVGYDYRHLQTSMHAHTCIMGYCVTHAGQLCKWRTSLREGSGDTIFG